MMRVLITGSSGGIGKHLLSHYSKIGHDVVGMSSSDADLSDHEQTRTFFHVLGVSDFDLVIHCAAKNATSRFDRMSLSLFRSIIDSNIIGTFNLLQCILPRLSRHGNIVLFSSSAAVAPRICQSAYAASKSALTGLVKCLAQEFLVYEKYIFIIAPGMVEAGMPYKMMNAEARVAACNNIPMGRFCTMEEIINTINYVVKTPYLTGQTIHLNGGYVVL
jgi:3-oxoacyl-[acyl-carrier protein] reductase